VDGSLAVSESFEEGCLKLRSHCFRCVSKLGLDKFESQEYLQFEVLRELIINDSDKCTANLDNLLLYCKGFRKVQNVLEGEGSVCSYLDLSVHDCSLNVVNDALDSLRVFQYH
jgi:hypothetical protein